MAYSGSLCFNQRAVIEFLVAEKGIRKEHSSYSPEVSHALEPSKKSCVGKGSGMTMTLK
jgi:hypothetical protein